MNARAWAAVLLTTLAVGTAFGFNGARVNPGSAPSGGGVTVGEPISGGTASRLLFSDASTQVSTASPALGAALTLTGALSGTSSNFTGQMVFDGATTDISTGTGQDLTITPNGAGKTVLGGTGITVNGTAEFQSSISNTTASTCFTGVTGTICIADADGLTIAPTTVNGAVLNLRLNSASLAASIETWDQNSARMGAFGSFGSGTAAGLAGKTGFFTRTSASTLIGSTTNVAAGTAVLEVRDGAAGAFDSLLASVDGAGNLFLNASATRSKGTITLAAGTGTATVASGSICVCSDTTAVNAVRCAVASTTLTATGTGTDVVSYLCL